ncbi:MAG: DUF1801 domain-containing protein [Clostridia bacterium]|nr:DUF1801 domain-containing protein [Clostridia bacterium]
MNPIDEYILRQDEAIQPKLQAIRETIRAAIPDAQEKVSYQMPTYWKGRNIIHFAVFKNHIGLYPGGEAPAVFASRLKDYKTGRGTIRFPLDRELPLDLISEIAAWCYERYAKV